MEKNKTYSSKKLSEVYTEIREMPYFSEFDTQFGMIQDVNEDTSEIVYGLYRSKSEKTIVFMSHLNEEHPTSMALNDEIEIDNLSHRVHLNLLNAISKERREDLNVLFICISKEASPLPTLAGISQLLERLKTQYSLSYMMVISSERDTEKENSAVRVQSGIVGQMIPFIYVKGEPVNTFNPFSGIGSVGILNEIIKAIDQNTEMSDRAFGQMSPPPVFLGVRDLRSQFNSKAPEAIAAYFNWPFFKDNIDQKFIQLKELCVWSVEDAINQYNYSYNEYLRKQKKPSYINCHDICVEVLLYEELLDRYEGIFPVNHMDEVNGSIDVVRHMVESLDFKNPVVVIGLLPTYLPAVVNDDFFNASLMHWTEALSVEKQVMVRHEHFFSKSSILNLFNTFSEGVDAARTKMPMEPHAQKWQTLKKQLPILPLINIGANLSVDKNNCQQIYQQAQSNLEGFIYALINKINN